MARAKLDQDDTIERVKRLTIIALFSDDEFVDRFVLKGGNALAIGYGLDTRVSADVDLSMAGAFSPAELESVRGRITYRLEQTFKPEGWVPFDMRFEERPAEVSDDLAGFGGGYSLEFKLIDTREHERLSGDLVEMREYAQITGPGQRKRFDVDISRHEHCDPKQEIDIDGYTIYVCTPQLMVCEKLRAICQQLPEYDSVVKRHRDRPTARPRDFLDIHTLLTHFDDIDLDGPDIRELLAQVFAAKRVPLDFLRSIKNGFDQHVTAWRAVQDTVRPGFDLKDFRFYFHYAVGIAKRLHPGGNM